MGMTITEKILAGHSGREQVRPGEIVWVEVDVLMINDVTGPGTIGIFHEQFGTEAKVFDAEKVVVIGDHYIHTKDEKCLRNVDVLRDFVKEQGIRYFYGPGTDSYRGVCHVTLPQEGHTRPGEILLGADSHTCTHGAFGELATGIGNTEAAFVMGRGKLWLRVPETMRFVFDGQLDERVMAKDMILTVIGDIGVDGANYRSMEFSGQTVKGCSMEERMTLCNMAIEAGGKNGIIAADKKVEQYLAKRDKSGKKYTLLDNDGDAKFASVRSYKAEDIEPMVARPHSPANVATARSLKGVSIERVYIG
ncbi:MAG: 3-isopropylmalate dehydratase, partial [Phycisphaerae bacterium]|nr:3-isopropylmalate dehydratase [Phycisphaerae bacterium]